MALDRFIDSTIEAPVAAVRRIAISVAICAAALIGALYYVAAASVLYLEATMSPAAARLIVAAAFLVIAVIAVAMPKMARKQGMVERAQTQAQSLSRDEKIALIIEAIVAGFSLSSRRSAGKPPR